MDFSSYRSVVISDYDLVKTCFEDPNFASRYEYPAYAEEYWSNLRGGKEKEVGIAFNEGKTWAEQRRFTFHTLKDLGFGKLSMQESILEQAVDLCDAIYEELKTCRDVMLGDKIKVCTFNSLLVILVGKKLDMKSEKDLEIFKCISTALSFVGNFHPWQRFSLILYHYTGIKTPTLARHQSAVRFLRNLMMSYVDEHESTLQEDLTRDFLDCYIADIIDIIRLILAMTKVHPFMVKLVRSTASIACSTSSMSALRPPQLL